MYYFLFFFSSCLHACDYWRGNLGTKMGRLALLPSPLASPFNFTRNFFMYPRVSIWIIFVNRKKENRRLAHDLISLFFFFLLLSSMLGGSGGGGVVVDVLVKMEKCQIYWERKKKSLKKSKEHISDQHSSSLN